MLYSLGLIVFWILTLGAIGIEWEIRDRETGQRIRGRLPGWSNLFNNKEPRP